MITYQYACDQNEMVWNIDSINPDNRYSNTFYCIGCKGEMIPKLGQKKRHHFAHKTVEKCSGETYLHLLGKKLFKQEYLNCLSENSPFLIAITHKQICNCYHEHIGRECRKVDRLENFDLTQYYDDIIEEEREGSFIPDLKLVSKSNSKLPVVFIEIAVHHLSTIEKRNSRYRIIELKLESESDLKSVRRRRLTDKNSKVEFINFKKEPVRANICENVCSNWFTYLVLFKDGRISMKRRKPQNFMDFYSKNRDNIQTFSIAYNNGDNAYSYSSVLFKYFAAKCHREGYLVINCFLCKYHALDFHRIREEPIFCKTLLHGCNPMFANACERFNLGKNYVHAYYWEGKQDYFAHKNLNGDEIIQSQKRFRT